MKSEFQKGMNQSKLHYEDFVLKFVQSGRLGDDHILSDEGKRKFDEYVIEKKGERDWIEYKNGSKPKFILVQENIRYLKSLKDDQGLVDFINLSCFVTNNGKKEFGLYHLNKKMLLQDLERYLNRPSQGFGFNNWMDDLIFIIRFYKMMEDKKLPFSFIEKYKERYWFKYNFLEDFKSHDPNIIISSKLRNMDIWKIKNDPYKILQSYEGKIIERVLKSKVKDYFWYYRLIRDINNHFSSSEYKEWTLPRSGVRDYMRLYPRDFRTREELMFDERNRYLGMSYTNELDEYRNYWEKRYLKEIKRFKNDFENSWEEVVEYSLR